MAVFRLLPVDGAGLVEVSVAEVAADEREAKRAMTTEGTGPSSVRSMVLCTERSERWETFQYERGVKHYFILTVESTITLIENRK